MTLNVTEASREKTGSSEDEVKKEELAKMLAEAAAERTRRRKSKKDSKRTSSQDPDQGGKGDAAGGHYVQLGGARIFVRNNSSIRSTEV